MTTKNLAQLRWYYVSFLLLHMENILCMFLFYKYTNISEDIHNKYDAAIKEGPQLKIIFCALQNRMWIEEKCIVQKAHV